METTFRRAYAEAAILHGTVTLDDIETLYFGKPRQGGLAHRVAALERRVFGALRQGRVPARIEALREHFYGELGATPPASTAPQAAAEDAGPGPLVAQASSDEVGPPAELPDEGPPDEDQLPDLHPADESAVLLDAAESRDIWGAESDEQLAHYRRTGAIVREYVLAIGRRLSLNVAPERSCSCQQERCSCNGGFGLLPPPFSLMSCHYLYMNSLRREESRRDIEWLVRNASFPILVRVYAYVHSPRPACTLVATTGGEANAVVDCLIQVWREELQVDLGV